MDTSRSAASATASRCRCRTTSSTNCPFPPSRNGFAGIPTCASAWPGRFPAGSAAANCRAWPSAAAHLRRCSRPPGEGRGCHDDGHRAHLNILLKDKTSAASSRSSRTNRAPSAWKACSASRHLEPAGPELYVAGRPRPADVLQGVETGQVLQEGINEAGAMSDWIAAATSYSVHGR